MSETLEDDGGRLEIRELPEGGYELVAMPRDSSVHVPLSSIRVDYPLDLIRSIFAAYGSLYTCDEVARDIEETEASIDVRYSVAAYCDSDFFSQPLDILDYGCGGGSSTMTLARLFPRARIVGMDYMPQFLEVARGRAAHRKLARVRFQQVESSGEQPLPPAAFDAAFLNAVYEHLLPAERPTVVANIWTSLRSGGVFFLNQTPHRYFPIETHTSGLPMVNYLPDRLAQWAVTHFSSRVVRSYTWEQLLRAGVRGATVTEIMRNIKRVDPQANQLRSIRIAGSWAGIWYAAKRHRMNRASYKTLIHLAEMFVNRTGLPLTPYISFAARKSQA
jgi:2-polyprenyl-3-methyl-5-hydroxy-6-metoxy-1,4-benzoquinol methylase